MAKHPTEKSSRQDLVVVNRATVQIPLPLFSALEDTESAFFDVCIGLRRPRLRSTEDRELRLPSFEARSKQDPRDRHALEALASGVTRRHCARGLEAFAAGGRADVRSTRRYARMAGSALREVLCPPRGARGARAPREPLQNQEGCGGGGGNRTRVENDSTA